MPCAHSLPRTAAGVKGNETEVRWKSGGNQVEIRWNLSGRLGRKFQAEPAGTFAAGTGKSFLGVARPRKHLPRPALLEGLAGALRGVELKHQSNSASVCGRDNPRPAPNRRK